MSRARSIQHYSTYECNYEDLRQTFSKRRAWFWDVDIPGINSSLSHKVHRALLTKRSAKPYRISFLNLCIDSQKIQLPQTFPFLKNIYKYMEKPIYRSTYAITHISVGLDIPSTCHFRIHPSYTQNEHDRSHKILPNSWRS